MQARERSFGPYAVGMKASETLSAENVVWDLDPILDGHVSIGALLDTAQLEAASLAGQRGRVHLLDAPELATLLRGAERVLELLSRAGEHANLRFAADTSIAANGADVALVSERSAVIGNELLFIELEWAAVPDERAEALLCRDDLAFCRHYLATVRRYRPHLLSEAEERVIQQKTVTGTSAWVRLGDELTAAMTVELDGEEGPVPYEKVFTRLESPDRAIRAQAAAAMTTALQAELKTKAYIYNVLLADKSTDDRLRSYESWVSSRNLANQATDASVAALIEAVTARFELARRWYRLEARLLGLERLCDYDRIADVGATNGLGRSIGWDQAVATVLDAFQTFSPELAATATPFFSDRRIDAALRPAKMGGAFCSPSVPSSHPYLLLNFEGSRNDVLTLAHELGHGVHFSLSRPQGLFHRSVPLTVAETASVFGETLTFERLLAEETDPRARLSLLASNIEGTIATVFRQVAMWHFEDRCHRQRRTSGELTIADFNTHWATTQTELLGDSVEITDGYRCWWSYVSHFFHTPGYVYAYAFGQLLALSVYRRYETEGPSFVGNYLDLLRAGGSRSPEELAAMVGCDLTDPEFWNDGLALVERQLVRAEESAEAVLAG